MHPEGSGVTKHELTYQNISGLSGRLKITGIEQVPPGLLCIHTLWVKSVKVTEKIKERKIENSVGTGTQSCFFPFPTSNGSESSSLKLTDF